MVRIIYVAVLLTAALPAAAVAQRTLAPAGGRQHNLVEDGRGLATIVLPAQAEELETYAAKEFQTYVKAITGAELPIVSEPQRLQRYGVWIGRTSAAEAADFALNEEKLGRDGYAAQADDLGLVVVGPRPLGTPTTA